MDSAGDIEAWQAWGKKAQDIAETEARRLSADLPQELAAMRAGSDARIILKQMTESCSYQCEGGHFYQIEDGKAPDICPRCGKRVVSNCSCGALLSLTYQYKPPYRKVNPISQGAREACSVCHQLYPWAQSHLFRPTTDALDDYDEQLLKYADGFPSNRVLREDQARIIATIPKQPVNLFHRLFGTSVDVSDARHPRHSEWTSVSAAHENRIEVFRAKVLSTRADALRVQDRKARKRDYWHDLSGSEFEIELARLLEAAGFVVKHVGGRNDQGADLMIQNADSRVLVQCKAFSKPVGPGPVRDLLGALHHHRVAEAWLVSLVGFTDAATQFASGKLIRLLPIESLLGPDGSKNLTKLKRSFGTQPRR